MMLWALRYALGVDPSSTEPPSWSTAWSWLGAAGAHGAHVLAIVGLD